MQAVPGVRWYGQPGLLPAPPPPRQGGAAAGGVRPSAGAQATGRSFELKKSSAEYQDFLTKFYRIFNLGVQYMNPWWEDLI